MRRGWSKGVSRTKLYEHVMIMMEDIDRGSLKITRVNNSCWGWDRGRERVKREKNSSRRKGMGVEKLGKCHIFVKIYPLILQKDFWTCFYILCSLRLSYVFKDPLEYCILFTLPLKIKFLGQELKFKPQGRGASNVSIGQPYPYYYPVVSNNPILGVGGITHHSYEK